MSKENETADPETRLLFQIIGACEALKERTLRLAATYDMVPILRIQEYIEDRFGINLGSFYEEGEKEEK